MPNDTTAHPLRCAACGGPIEDGQPVERPMPPFKDDTPWVMHALFRDCLRAVIADAEQEVQEEHAR